ncbi:MAG: hypothetical protein R3F39_11875 [Myxococcota bacterium]
MAVWPLCYFWLQTGPGQRGMRDSLLRDLRPGSLNFHSVHWGPDPRELWLCDAMIRTRAGAPAIGAGTIGGALSMGALVKGLIHFEQTRATDFEVRLGWNAEGEFSLKGAFKDPKPEPSEPKGVPPLIRLDGIVLERGLVTLDWPSFGLSFADVGAAGRVHLGGEKGLVIDADLTGLASSATVADRGEGKPKGRVAFDRIAIEKFAWDGPGFAVGRLLLAAKTGAEVSVAGGLGFAEDAGFFEARGSVRVGAPEVGELLAPWTPQGFAAEGLVIDSRGGKSVLAVERAQVEELLAGPVRVLGLALPVKAEASGVGSMGQKGAFETHGVVARRVEGPKDVALDGVSIEALTAKGSTSGDVALTGLKAATLHLPAGATQNLSAHGKAQAGLTGGSLSGQVASDAGTVDAKGKLGVNLLTGDVSVEIGLTLAQLRDALAKTVLDALPDDVASHLRPPLEGDAKVTGRISREKDESGKARWGLHLNLESGEIRGDERAELRDGSWVLAAVPAVPLP